MFGLGLSEILLVGLILVLVFGASRLPELGRGVGAGTRSFKGAIRGEAVDQGEAR
jgi:sec-independent protein translocase protein TatA